jgi:hypothetical protein
MPNLSIKIEENGEDFESRLCNKVLFVSFNCATADCTIETLGAKILFKANSSSKNENTGYGVFLSPERPCRK